jgi:hypothetical protein
MEHVEGVDDVAEVGEENVAQTVGAQILRVEGLQ